MADITFEDMFKISTRSLRFNRSHPEIVRDRAWKIQFCVLLTICSIVFMLLLNSILFHDIRNGKFVDVSKNTAILIVSVTVTIKYVSLLLHQESIKDMIRYLEADYSGDNNYTEEDRTTVLQYAERGRSVTTFWWYAGFGTSAIFPVKALVAMGYYYWKGEFRLVHMFELTYPEPLESYKNDTVVFWLLFGFHLSFAFSAATMYVGFDPLGPIFLLHICGQLVIISRRLNTLFDDIKDTKEIENELKTMIKNVQCLYEFMDRMKLNFSVLYEFIMKTTTILMPLTTFQIIEDLRNNWINLEFITFLTGVILHFFMPSYYSDLLMETSEQYRQAIYSSGWEKCPDTRVRKIILIMITRARIPMGIRTVFSEINLDTYAEMCRQSYSILNLMNAAWR